MLHLAPRSVRDLIYSGRLPSLRIGRLHYLRATDLELERRRRLGLQLPSRQPRAPRAPRARTAAQPTRSPVTHGHVDPALRRERAAERAALVNQWAERHHPAGPDLPFAATVASVPTMCAICHRTLRAGARVLQPAQDRTQLCLTCGRRVLLDWADHRRQEAAAARRMANDLGSDAARNPPTRIASLAPLRHSEETGSETPDPGCEVSEMVTATSHAVGEARETVTPMADSVGEARETVTPMADSDGAVRAMVVPTCDSRRQVTDTLTGASRSGTQHAGEVVPLTPRTAASERSEAGRHDPLALAN